MAWRILILGFLAGAIAVPIFHQLAVLALYSAGYVPNAPFRTNPVAPFGVPTILNQAFWGGMWGLLFGAIMMARPRLSPLIVGVAVGILGAALAGLTWIALLRGQAMPITDLNRWWRPVVINGTWGLGMGVIFAALHGRGAPR